jgi:hypothetical protein
MNGLPSIKQMLNRANSGHRRALNAIAHSKPLLGPTAYAGEIRGMQSVLSTLRRWDCVSNDGLTERGEELRTLLNERHEKAMAES